MARVAIALGSNLGDRRAHLEAAIDLLMPHLRRALVSTFHDTAPVGVEPQPNFLNGAIVGEAQLPPLALLKRLLSIEEQLGRTRPYWGAPRTIDLDLVLYDDVVLQEPGMQIPHPRFRERLFVLEPLAEIAPDLVDPVTGKTVAELLEDLKAGNSDEVGSRK
ncbi:MAG TPA: 2-amino-4-hydroxy-6-hydroxymethyldihydropteridine diphosphokinase [Vicinamibacterales bacterium]